MSASAQGILAVSHSHAGLVAAAWLVAHGRFLAAMDHRHDQASIAGCRAAVRAQLGAHLCA